MQRWWQTSQTILVAGVFEGGGAKGIAYAGALHAMCDQRCWFRAVAGASAGAITAALVAAGLTPDEIEAETSLGLRSLCGSAFRGIRRLAPSGAFYESVVLQDWLEGILARQVREPGVEPSADGVSFAELYQATGIELNVVAADLTLRRQVVFSHLDTPQCQVARAVLASSAIPFAFESGALAMSCAGDAESERRHHLIVDGGVWSNYPDFVFRDPAFRLSQRRPELPAEDLVIGFLLRVGDDAAEVAALRDMLQNARFEELSTATPCALERHRPAVAAREFEAPTRGVLAEAFGLVLKVGVVFGLVIFALVRVMAWMFGTVLGNLLSEVAEDLGRELDKLRDSLASLRGRSRAVQVPIPRRHSDERLWWEPRLSGGSAAVATAAGTALGSMQFPLAGGLLWGLVAFFLAPLAVGALTDAVVATFSFAEAPFWPRVGEVMSDLVGLLLTVGFAAFVMLFLVFLAELIVANCLAHVGLRRLALPLAFTYVSGTGAPPWAGTADGEHAVRLTVPPAVQTLSFTIDDEVRQQVIDSAREQARQQLAAILAKRHEDAQQGDTAPGNDLREATRTPGTHEHPGQEPRCS
jgi:predicted acylesterase/phospholipase RssA